MWRAARGGSRFENVDSAAKVGQTTDGEWGTSCSSAVAGVMWERALEACSAATIRSLFMRMPGGTKGDLHAVAAVARPILVPTNAHASTRLQASVGQAPSERWWPSQHARRCIQLAGTRVWTHGPQACTDGCRARLPTRSHRTEMTLNENQARQCADLWLHDIVKPSLAKR